MLTNILWLGAFGACIVFYIVASWTGKIYVVAESAVWSSDVASSGSWFICNSIIYNLDMKYFDDGWMLLGAMVISDIEDLTFISCDQLWYSLLGVYLFYVVFGDWENLLRGCCLTLSTLITCRCSCICMHLVTLPLATGTCILSSCLYDCEWYYCLMEIC